MNGEDWPFGDIYQPPPICVPCLDVRHDECDPAPWCECFTELLIEAEEMT